MNLAQMLGHLDRSHDSQTDSTSNPLSESRFDPGLPFPVRTISLAQARRPAADPDVECLDTSPFSPLMLNPSHHSVASYIYKKTGLSHDPRPAVYTPTRGGACHNCQANFDWPERFWGGSSLSHWDVFRDRRWPARQCYARTCVALRKHDRDADGRSGVSQASSSKK